MSNSDNIDNQEAVKLEACPFCGGNAGCWQGKVSAIAYYCELHRDDWFIGCGRCGLMTQPFPTREEAFALWNRRTTPAKLDAPDNQEALAGEGVKLEWRCFHCGDVFTSEQCARLHFGRDEGATPACIIKGADGGLLKALRDAEEQADDAVQAMQNESTDASKAYHRQRCRHSQALIAAEESGYEKGLADGRTLPSNEALAGDDRSGVEGLREALDDLQQAEAEYRLMHDRHGDGAQAAGRAWDLMRRAGDKARLALSRTPSSPQADSTSTSEGERP